MRKATTRGKWTAEDVLALGTRTDLVTACRIAYGCAKNTAWQKFHAGTLDFPALRVGRRVVVPVAPLLELLGIASPSTNGPRVTEPGAAALTTTAPQTNGATPDDATARHLRRVG
jgi:hypothetical protein